MHETDRRVVYTKKLLRDSLMRLMNDKPINQISVTELCRAAGVNRGTFYSHYRQPEDILLQIEDEIITSIKSILTSISDVSDIYRAVTRALAHSWDECRVLVGKNGDPACINRMLEISREYFLANWHDPLGLNAAETRYLHTFMFAGVISVLKEWLLNDPLRTPDEMAELLSGMHTRIENG